tara:strand:+ start:5771 stop:6772 length:1002 start_codon:yes stop_codon:yes gene_type:complete
MSDMLALAESNLLSPMVLFFALGFIAAAVRSDLHFPEAVAKALSLYLLAAIGFKGGVIVAESGIDAKMMATIGAGIFLSALIPFIAFQLLRALSSLPRIDVAAVAAHYGSISIVTFVAATSALTTLGISSEGYLVAVAAVMESPAIIAALILARGKSKDATSAPDPSNGFNTELVREVLLNGSIVLLTGAFIIGWITGPDGMAQVSSFIVDPFKGVLCLFLLDMGLIAGRGIRQSAHELKPGVIFFGLIMPPIGAAIALAAGIVIDLDIGSTALLMTLAASASYIAVPAAMRVALPEARPEIYLTLSLGITFPFNLTVGIPLYVWAAEKIIGG